MTYEVFTSKDFLLPWCLELKLKKNGVVVLFDLYVVVLFAVVWVTRESDVVKELQWVCRGKMFSEHIWECCKRNPLHSEHSLKWFIQNHLSFVLWVDKTMELRGVILVLLESEK
jgi:hypothetical protein